MWYILWNISPNTTVWNCDHPYESMNAAIDIIKCKEMSIQESGKYIIHSGRRGRDRMVVGFTTTYAISVYYH